MEKWGKKISNYLVKDESLEEEKEIVEFGITQGIFFIVNFCVFLIICGFFDMFFDGILFLMAFTPLRVYAGGYHADTRKQCFCLSTGIAVMVASALKYVVVTKAIIVFAIMIFGIIVVTAPMENVNRSLDIREYTIFRKRTRCIQAVEMCVFLIAYVTGTVKVFKGILFAQYLMLLLLGAGYIKNIIQKN